jgi:hypothetical protein
VYGSECGIERKVSGVDIGIYLLHLKSTSFDLTLFKGDENPYYIDVFENSGC